MYAIGDWSAVEYAIGTTLPSDYKKFITAYGAGYIGNQFFLQIHNPFVWTALGRDIRKAWINWSSMYHDFAVTLQAPAVGLVGSGGSLPSVM